MNATCRHSCAICQDIHLPTDRVKNSKGKVFETEHGIVIATAPHEAVPGSTIPSGICPRCGGPLYCCDIHPT